MCPAWLVECKRFLLTSSHRSSVFHAFRAQPCQAEVRFQGLKRPVNCSWVPLVQRRRKKTVTRRVESKSRDVHHSMNHTFLENVGEAVRAPRPPVTQSPDSNGTYVRAAAPCTQPRRRFVFFFVFLKKKASKLPRLVEVCALVLQVPESLAHRSVSESETLKCHRSHSDRGVLFN